MDDRTKDAARRHVEGFTARLADIRANRRLSEVGKRETIKEDYEKTKAQISAIKHEAAAQGESRQTQLQRRLFGLKPGQSGSDTVAHRDAVDRAAQAKTADALAELMQAASLANDQSLIRAAAGRAHRLSGGVGGEKFRPLVRAYVDDQGGQAVSDLEEYTQLTSSASKAEAMIESMATSLSRPKELDDRHVPDATPPGPQPGDYRTASGWVRGNG
jgi:hypothetical protein